ncbi:MAG: prolipoprotein diacylglyceryl transferase [Aureispira sp.]|nr:prolipoprotein diacylglyceryl transferase [Aureispira sp.]
MYPNLRYAFYDIFGIDLPMLGLVQSYGFFLALAFFVSGTLLHLELKRRENLGMLKGIEESVKVGKPLSIIDLAINGIIGFILGFKGVYAIMNTDLFTGPDAKDALFSMAHGNWITGVLLAAGFVGWKYYEKKKELEEYPKPQVIKETVMPHQRVSDIVIISAVSGIFGAKMLYVVEYSTAQTFWEDLTSGSGLTVYGGLIFAFFVVSYYIHRKQIPLRQMLDVCSPALIMAYGIGRLGCHFSGDGDWGDPNLAPRPNWLSWLPDWMWAYRYPNNVINEGLILDDCVYPDAFGDYCHVLAQAVYPTAVWEFLMGSVIFLILWSLRKRIKIHGLLFSVYLMFNGIERFMIEVIRVNDNYTVLGIRMTQSQAIAIVLFTIGLFFTVYLGRQQMQLKDKPDKLSE